MFQSGAGLLHVSMGPNVNACSSRRGAPSVFKSVSHVLDATLDKPGHGNLDLLAFVPSMYSMYGGNNSRVLYDTVYDTVFIIYILYMGAVL